MKNRTSRKFKPTSIPVDALISDTAKMGMKCKVGHYSKIGQNCRIGDNVVIGDCVTIEQDTKIRNNCVIQSGVVIRADGFAYERDEQSFELERFPHIGGVKIGNNVQVSCNCSIARGSLSDTIIGDDTKIDALVGSTKVGNVSWCGLNCTIKHKLIIGNSVNIHMKIEIYVIGVYMDDWTPSDRLLVYKPTTNEWTQSISLPTARGSANSHFVNGTLYVIGGDANEQ